MTCRLTRGEGHHDAHGLPVSEQTYPCVALEDPIGQWERHRGRVSAKPATTVAYGLSVTGGYDGVGNRKGQRTDRGTGEGTSGERAVAGRRRTGDGVGE